MKKSLFFLLVLSVIFTACSKENNPENKGGIPTAITVSEKGAEVILEVVSAGAWKITQPEYAYWYSIAPLSGNGNAKVTLQIKENRDVVKRSDKIVFSINGETLELPLEQTAGSSLSRYADKEIRIHTKVRSGKAVNLLFMGDGFIQEDFAPAGAFDKAVDEAVKGWFEVEPYKSYKEYFNIYKIGAISAERGASHNSRNVKKNTVFSVLYTGEKEGESGMTVNEDKVNEYIKVLTNASDIRKIDNLEVIVIVNDNRYGGTTTMWTLGPSIALCPMNRDAKLPGGFVNVLVHEAGGHGFGHLADEYQTKRGEIPEDIKATIKQFQGYGLYKNLSLTSDKTKVPWNDFIGTLGYSEVSVFEGGFNYSKGTWRSEYLSCMDINSFYFNAPSRRAIVQRIKSMTGEVFSMSEFVQKDVQKMYPFSKEYAQTKANYNTLRPRLAPPLVKIAYD